MVRGWVLSFCVLSVHLLSVQIVLVQVLSVPVLSVQNRREAGWVLAIPGVPSMLLEREEQQILFVECWL